MKPWLSLQRQTERRFSGLLCTTLLLASLGCDGPVPREDGESPEASLRQPEGAPVRWVPCLPGMRRVKDIRPGAAGSLPEGLVDGDGVLVFSADDGQSGREPWATTGESRRTTLLKDIHRGGAGSAPSEITRVEDLVFFAADDGVSGRELWVTDGTASGTHQVRDIIPGLAGSAPEDLTAFNGVLYFFADDGVHGRELWRSDGTHGGTRLLREFSPPGSITYSTDMVAGEDFLYITVFAGPHARERLQLWKTDGKAGGFTRLYSGFEDESIYDMTQVGGRLFFVLNVDRPEYELFVVDADDSVHFLRRFPGQPHDLVSFNGQLYFASGGGEAPGYLGDELWRSNGTPAGTVLVKDLFPGAVGSEPRELTVLGFWLFFSADDGVHGREFWRSEGTPTGTLMLDDFEPGPVGSDPRELVVHQYRIFMSVDTSGRGREPWVHDGGADGSTPLPEVAPGPASSNPRDFTLSGWDVFLSADDGVSGRELWAQSYRPPGRCSRLAP